LTGLVRTCLETDFSDVWLEGEISNLRAPGSGHLYCTMKDDVSQIRGVIFRTTAMRLRFGLTDGLHVIARGRLSVYEPRGEYQIVVDYIEPKGIGALQLALEQLKQRLSIEGLFDVNRKRCLPAFPRAVGIITSLTGAAVQDMITVLHRRCPILRIIVAPVQVQGEGAAEQIANAVRALNDMGEVDVIIVGRGGGSAEDLSAFNEEAVVRAIARSAIPIVSAVGHESDVTLADFVADVRAPTPSAAAEAVVPVSLDVLARIEELVLRSGQAMSRRCGNERQRLRLCLARFTRLRFRILEEAQRVDAAVLQMTQAIHGAVMDGRETVNRIKHELMTRSPRTRIHQGLGVVPQLMSRLCGVMQHGLHRRRQVAAAGFTSLHHLSPLSALSRGYSTVETLPSHQVVRDASQVSKGQEVLARLAKGQLRCIVQETLSDSSVLK
jgi:exodeoxyribonuclease VII large subunit